MSGARVDESRPVRDEDAFDVAAVEAWLDRGPIAEVRQFPGGASNLTYLLRMQDGPDLILRRPPVGTKAKGAHDMGREYRIQDALEPVFPQVPAMAAYCTAEDSPIGSELYVMERLDGLIPRRDFGFPVSESQASAGITQSCTRNGTGMKMTKPTRNAWTTRRRSMSRSFSRIVAAMNESVMPAPPTATQ